MIKVGKMIALISMAFMFTSLADSASAFVHPDVVEKDQISPSEVEKYGLKIHILDENKQSTETINPYERYSLSISNEGTDAVIPNFNFCVTNGLRNNNVIKDDIKIFLNDKETDITELTIMPGEIANYQMELRNPETWMPGDPIAINLCQ